MLEFVKEALYNTPWWVYVLFIYLLKRGFQATKTNIVSLKKLFFMPILFTILSIHTLVTEVSLNGINIGSWLVSIIIGGLIGWLLVNHHEFKIDRSHRLIKLPGNWITLTLIMIIFISKYIFGFAMGYDPNIIKSVAFDISLLIVSGLYTGTFIGRVVCYLSKFYTQISENLTKQLADELES